MILSKENRDKLRKAVHIERTGNSCLLSKKDLLLIISALISDFEELECILSKMYIIFISGKDIAEILDSLCEILSPDIVDSLHFQKQTKIIKDLSAITANAQNLKRTLAELRYANQYIMQ